MMAAGAGLVWRTVNRWPEIFGSPNDFENPPDWLTDHLASGSLVLLTVMQTAGSASEYAGC
jgi:hypothetical protein